MRIVVTTLLMACGLSILACTGLDPLSPADTDELPAVDDTDTDTTEKATEDNDGSDDRPSGRRGTSRADGTQPAPPSTGGGGGSRSGGAPPSTGDGATDPGDPPSWLTDLGNNKWKVPRSKVNAWTNDPSALGNARAKGSGYELRGVRSGSDGWWLGMRNSDVVRRVNGYSLGSQAEALIAFAAVQNASTIEVRLKRDGSPRLHTYVIED